MIDDKSIQHIIKEIEGASTGEYSQVKRWLDSGNYALNKVISGDYSSGLPFGRVMELFGDPSTGKSLLIYHWIANVQKLGGVAILDDTEDAYTSSFGSKLGIDNSALILLNSLTVEEHFEKVFLGWKDSKGKLKPGLVDLIWEQDTKCPILVALDSLALLSTRHELEVRLEKPDMTKAKIIRAALRNSSGWIKKGHILHAISNHVTSKIGVVFGSNRTTPGGSGVPFSASVRLELFYTGKIKDEDSDKVIGVKTKVKCAKNRVAPPHQECELEISFEKGVSKFSGLLDNLLRNGVAKEGEKKGYIELLGEQIKKSEFDNYMANHLDKLEIQKSSKSEVKSNSVITIKSS